MWAPRSKDDWLERCRALCFFTIDNPNSLEPFWVPIGLLQAPFAGVFEKLIHRCEQQARSLHVQSQVEIELVVQEMNIAVTEHAEECAGSVEIVDMNDSFTDAKTRARLVRDAVPAAGNDMV